MSQVLENRLLAVDDTGVAKIANTRITVAQIVLEYTQFGQTMEQIAASHPHLSLAQVQAALVYYDNHQKIIETQISESLAYADKARQEAGTSELAARLRAQKQAAGQTG